MTVIDNLQIVIDADAKGLETTMKRVIGIATGAVGEINKQEVDWTSIFSRSVSPAIISGIAAMFAMAISQSMNFQQAMATTGTAAGMSAGQITQMSNAALQMSTVLPNSAGTLATSMTAVSTLFGKNTQATNDITQAMAQLSDSGFGSLNEITQTAMELFRQFGVTTEKDAIAVLTDLMHAAQGANTQIPVLGQEFEKFSGALPAAERSIAGLNGQLSTFASYLVQIGPNATEGIFGALATSAGNLVGPLELALGKSASAIDSALKSGNISGILGDMANKVTAMGDTAKLVLPGFGFSQDQIAAFTTADRSLQAINTDQAAIFNNPQSIAQAFAESDSTLRTLMTDWNKFTASMIGIGNLFAPLATGFLGELGVMMDSANSFFKNLTDGFAGVILDLTGGKFGKAFADLTGTLANNLLITPGNQVVANLDRLSGTKNSSALNANLLATGVGFNEGVLQRLDASASQSGMMSSLISALQTGGKGDQYASTISTFNLTLPAGPNGWTPRDLANALYAKFQGTTQ